MEDIYDFDKQTYIPSSHEETTIFYEIGQFIKFIYTVIKFIILSVITFVQVIQNSFAKSEQHTKLAGKLALVTGGGNGLGRAIALELAKHGCNVAILDVDFNGGEKTAANCRSLQVNAKAYKIDVSDYEAVKKVCPDIEDDLGPVDILVNNAALLPAISLHEGTSGDIERILKVNIASHFWTTRVFMQSMLRRRRGHIVAISSTAGIDALGRAVCYSTTKYAIKGFMDALHEEFTIERILDEIKLTTVFPRFIGTRQNLVKILKFHLGNNISKLSTPEEVAEATINGIIKNKRYVSLPGSFMFWHHFMSLLPVEFEDLHKRLFKPRPTIKFYR